jgi:hypothetical protein
MSFRLCSTAFFLTVLGCVSVAFTESARASTILLTINSDVGVTGSAPQTFSGTSAGPSLTQPALSLLNLNGSASTSGSVQFGTITGSVAAGANPGPITLSAEADFVGIWQDTLTVTSSTLASGTPSTICDGANNSPQEIAAFSAGSQQVLASSTACNAAFSGTRQLLVSTFVGNTLPIEGQLHLTADAGVNSSDQVDPPVSFFVDPVTAGASYTTGSGTSYLSPSTATTPEPTPVVLLGTGVLMLGILHPKWATRVAKFLASA